MGLEIIKDGVVVHQDGRNPSEELIQRQEQIINDLKNQIKDLQSKLYVLQNEK
jgi:hypothetical protein